MEESDDDVEHDEDAPGEKVAPFLDQKLKHYKVFEGMPVTFSCKVIGDPKPKVRGHMQSSSPIIVTFMLLVSNFGLKSEKMLIMT